MIYFFFERLSDAENSLEKLCRMEKTLQRMRKKKQYGVRKNKEGKPIWKGGGVSCSHSGKWFVAAFAPSSVGVDVQKKGDYDWERIAKRFGAEAENEAAFYRRWVAAECAFKAYGIPVIEALDTEQYEKEIQWIFLEQDYVCGALGRGAIRFVEQVDLS